MKIRVIDFETTGFDKEEGAKVVEAAFCDLWLDGGEPVPSRPESALFDPGEEMPPEVQAVHHISNADVAGCPPSWQCAPWLMEGMQPGDMFAAHNAKFDRQFFGGGDHEWICTYKSALVVWPDAPGHSNQVLRYWLEVDGDDGFSRLLAEPPHRAGPDTYVTAHILTRLLRLREPAALAKLTRHPPKLNILTFGKHKGEKWDNAPTDYLEWIAYKSDMDDDIKANARLRLKQRGLLNA